MKKYLSLSLFFWCFTVAGIGSADNGLVVKKSAYSVTETLDRLEGILNNKGLTIFARVDHAAGAQKADMSLRPTQVLIFGNPKMGTPLISSSRTAGIDLPMKALVWEDQAGQVWLAYNQPQYLADRHAIKDRGAVIDKMTNALNGLTDKATQAE